MCNSRLALITLGSLTFLLLAPVNYFAQKRSPTTGGPSGATTRRDTILMREADIQNRELNMRILREPGKAKAPALSPEDRKLVVNQIFEDFERIQVVNRQLIQTSTTYKQMSSLAEEMNKRAKRLKSNLGIPGIEPEKHDSDKPPVTTDEELKASLQTLNTSVKSFVTNPLFQDPRVTDVRHLENLRRDISTVIDLSRVIKKAASSLAPH